MWPGMVTPDLSVSGNANLARVDFNNTDFNPVDYQGNPAIFTAGFSNDAGNMVLAVNAQSLSSTSGVAIADKFYSLMEPEASALGVSLSVSGGDLSASFNPGSTVNGAGVSFGTTSTSAGVVATISTVPEPASLTRLCSGALGIVGAILHTRRKKASKVASRQAGKPVFIR